MASTSELEEELGEVKVQFDLSRTKNLDLPETYRSNTTKEKLLIQYAENFQRQFKQLYSDRKRLLLTPFNECNVEKFICTTMRPTYLKYKELYDYDGCASFVADYLTYQPSARTLSTELPRIVSSSMTVLHAQKGHCFDYGILLASLLIGVGYDAYCVLGYASKDVCTMNLSRKTCPMLEEKPEAVSVEEREKRGRYAVRPSRDFISNFEKRLENKEKSRIESEERQKREEERRKILEAEAPPKDEYHGLRVHCWVLVLMGKREIAQSFFIEPTTGESHPLDWEEYLGIESLWNHKNYWVNMQDCSSGVKNMTYDLGDGATWEPFFPNVDKPLLVLPGEDPSVVAEDSDEKMAKDSKDSFQLPPSWTLPIYISPQNLESRCPKGSKTVVYYRAQVDKFADYLNSDGLTTKLTVYNDTARTQQSQLRLFYNHRTDLLKSRIKTLNTGETAEHFNEGRSRSLKSHTFYHSNPLRESNRTMEFYPHARVDCLTKREFNSKEMIEHFENRSDFLYYRHVTYEPAPKKRVEKSPLNIVKIVEKFHPNPEIPPNDDKAEIHYVLAKNRIKVVYQLEKERITASTIEYKTPPITSDQSIILSYNPDEIYVYQVDPYRKPAKNRETFEQLEKLVQSQEESIKQVRASEEETMSILRARQAEESEVVLKISVYDVARNETARRHKEEIELKKAEEERIRKEKEMDYLAPFLARIGDPPKLTREQMVEVSQACLRDMRCRLVTMANLIRVRFEEETEKLQRMQAWYKSKQGSLTKEEESEYIAFCSSCMFTLHTLETRLAKHKASAPVKYMELEERLKEDSRVAYAYI